MSNKHFLRIAVPTPLQRLFDYLPAPDVEPQHLKPGMRVLVPFSKRQLVGFLIEVTQETSLPENKLKSALKILDQEPIFQPDIYQLCSWAAEYYHYSLGEVLASALPVLLRKPDKSKSARKTPVVDRVELVRSASHKLNDEQQQAVTTIAAAQKEFKIFLLDGVTGSGKTEVYLQVITQILEAGKQVLVLVPEISLTPQTIDRFKRRFNDLIVALHSGLTDNQRLTAWREARTGKAKIVIGTRSAIFTAFSDLGLIIVDEEHDSSFKQQDRFRYHARDMAVMRANILGIPVVLGSATPSLETLFNVMRNRYEHLLLRERAGCAQMPTYQIIDLRNAQVEEGLSTQLIQTMREHLAKENQVMLFLNRRGFAPVLYCSQCTWIAECKRCDARMVYHRTPPRLHCHHCDAQMRIPKTCPSCQTAALQPVGLGTQRLEQILAHYFPGVQVLRVDRDSTARKGALEDLLARINTREPAILLGTQMLAKGHHFPQVTLVGIVDADSGLFSHDFRAAEQMGQLLLQVAGRAGRADKPGTVMVQTRHPEHPLLQLLLQQGYADFSLALLKEREKVAFPPYSYFAIFRAEAYVEQGAHDFLINIKNLAESTTDVITVLGPVPAILARRKGLHCKHLIIKSVKRNLLQNFLKDILPKVEKIPNQQAIKWVLDVDPIEV